MEAFLASLVQPHCSTVHNGAVVQSTHSDSRASTVSQASQLPVSLHFAEDSIDVLLAHPLMERRLLIYPLAGKPLQGNGTSSPAAGGVKVHATHHAHRHASCDAISVAKYTAAINATPSAVEPVGQYHAAIIVDAAGVIVDGASTTLEVEVPTSTTCNLQITAQ
ncbi:hypothetical protein L7F22_028759 [Adiantum nelumboides]|nr:hypothetical protein [Adiantum nelumboides]